MGRAAAAAGSQLGLTDVGAPPISYLVDPPQPLLPCPLSFRAARVKSDFTALTALQSNVAQTTAVYRQLKSDYDALAAALAEADLERGALAASFAHKAAALGELEATHAHACAAGRDLQGRLDAAAVAHAELVADVARLRDELADKVRGTWWCTAGKGRKVLMWCARQAGGCFIRHSVAPMLGRLVGAAGATV